MYTPVPKVMEESMSEIKKKKEKQQSKTLCCFMMDELLQITGCVHNLREGSNSPANWNLWAVYKLLMVRVHLPTESQKAVAEVLYSSCPARFPWHGHGQPGLDGKQAELNMIYFFPEAAVLPTAELPGRHLCQHKLPHKLKLWYFKWERWACSSNQCSCQ